MRLLLAGDVHGNPEHLVGLFNKADEFGCDAMVQLGDFGYWEHKVGGPEYLQIAEDHAVGLRIPLYWVDGNHENHEWLIDRYDLNADGFRVVRNKVYHIPRGHVWEWDGVTFMGFGGAYSIDKRGRTPFISWWPTEEPSQEEVDFAVDQALEHDIDVLFTHDCPTEVPIQAIFRQQGMGDFFVKNDWQANRSRAKISPVFRAAQPKRMYHGHYHIQYRINHQFPDDSECRVEGLGADVCAFPDSWTVLDTEHDL